MNEIVNCTRSPRERERVFGNSLRQHSIEDYNMMMEELHWRLIEFRRGEGRLALFCLVPKSPAIEWLRSWVSSELRSPGSERPVIPGARAAVGAPASNERA